MKINEMNMWEKIASSLRVLLAGFMVVMAVFLLFANDSVWAEEDKEEGWLEKYSQEIFIKAVNPGYVVDGVSNVGEMIEIARGDDTRGGERGMISLAGIAVRYTNSSGNTSVLVEFPENSYLVGESIILRLASSPEVELANLNYSKTLAMKGGITLMRGEEVLDEVCWTGKEGCYKDFSSAKPTSLVRNTITGEFAHDAEYEVVYDALAYRVDSLLEEEEKVNKVSQCKGVHFSELLSYYENSVSEQFVELYNAGAEQVLLDGCQIRYKNKNHVLKGIIGPEEYYLYYPEGFSLTKNPTNENTIELIDTNEEMIDKIAYPNGQRKGAAYAWIGYDENGERFWRVTYAPTPGAGNNYQEYKSCEAGKVINEATGNCVKVTTLAAAKVCPEGQYLNILTGRCKKYSTENVKVCKEGYYLNPETGRCRKIVENDGVNYGIEPEKYEEKSSFVALYAVVGVIGVGAVYLCYEFRRDIKRFFIRLYQRFR
ncbi:hypothetical protein IKE99_00810 [Candidatus Saccharibacteria bacterium]|nr:hypothetical protein [Candidatus Saccharibacteria bacterium]